MIFKLGLAFSFVLAVLKVLGVVTFTWFQVALPLLLAIGIVLTFLVITFLFWVWAATR